MKTKASKKLTAKNVIARQELWQQIPEKTQEIISGGMNPAGIVFGPQSLTKLKK